MGQAIDVPTEGQYLNVSEAARALGITPRAAKLRIEAGTLRAEEILRWTTGIPIEAIEESRRNTPRPGRPRKNQEVLV